MATGQDDRIVADGRAEDRSTGGELNAAVTRAIVAIHRRHVGRGPTRAQAFFRQNMLVSVLSEVMTQPERKLVESGRTALVADLRRELQATMHDDLVSAVEELTGCGVVALLSDVHIASDTAAQVFVLDRTIHPEAVADAPSDRFR
ncbi:MAG: hypothetical protein QOD44_1004 [Solirubrobacteraceae bacterium]|nr:hypothetical protein [Solirubrobacteraceae bacterium]